MADVFISYARDERDRADQIKEMLEGLGLSVFLDVEGLDGGDVFSDVLDRQVKTSGAVLGLWSPHALSRPWVRVECQIARDRGVLVPAIISPIDAIKDVPAMFYGIQHVDLSEFDGDATDQNWLKLVKALARTLERPELLTRAAGELKGGLSGDGEANENLRKELAQLRAELSSIRQQADAIPMKQEQSSKAPGLLPLLLAGGFTVAALAGFLILDPLHMLSPKAPTPSAEQVVAEQLASGKIALGNPVAVEEVRPPAEATPAPAATVSPKSDVNLSADTLAQQSKACEAGKGEDCYEAGRQLEIGLGVDRDEAAAAKLYDRACRLDVAKACSSAGAMLVRKGDDAVSITKAEAYYRQACNLGETASCKSQ